MKGKRQQCQAGTGIAFFGLLLFLLLSPGMLFAASDGSIVFDDIQLEEPLKYPDWFILPSGDLGDDLEDALAKGKQGIVVYFGQKRCSYCEQFLSLDLGTPDIRTYMQKNFDVLPIDIWGIEDITDTDGNEYTERDLSIKYQVNFTPSLIFYNSEGEKVFRLRGFYPPYKFRAALKYVVGEFYKTETFRDYLARAEPGVFFQEGGLTERDFFMAPPYELARTDQPAVKPLAVFFEQGNCHACDLLHSGPLNDDRLVAELDKMDVVQVNIASDDEVTTPSGKKTTAREWADELGIFHLPTILFFDEAGREVMRVDSIVQFYRMWGVLDYINRRAYNEQVDYQLWRLKQRDVAE
ncbi:thioredoxin family protein [Solemya velum gill symbiont]|uniref:thioredoxin family protein n=1 Tax=Solemya velum gill symbiont TaxID=2340 RepID=UPI0009961C78|nr:thioredoxin fold domain-containing protein [Solemya velum gill symbiont]